MIPPPPASTLFPYTTLFRSSGDLRDVTVAEALDHVVRYFPGLWVYKECANGSLRRVMVRVAAVRVVGAPSSDRKSTRLNSSHLGISYAVFCLKKKKYDGEPH